MKIAFVIACSQLLLIIIIQTIMIRRLKKQTRLQETSNKALHGCKESFISKKQTNDNSIFDH